MRAKKGFTIIELLTVVAVISILVTIVTVASVGSAKSARGKRAEAMRICLEQAIEAYYAQEGKWPNAIETKSKNMNEDTYTFTASEADSIFQDVVGKGFGKGGAKSMLVDASALYVCESSNVGNGGKGCFDNHANRERGDFCGNGHCRPGVDFSEAVKKGAKRRIALNQMAFGYPGVEHGKFRRFKVSYNCRTDKVHVSK